MSSKGSEMTMKQRRGDELQEIAEHVAAIRRDIENLTGKIAGLADHQPGRAGDETREAVEQAVRRDPFPALAIAASVGFLFGILGGARSASQTWACPCCGARRQDSRGRHRSSSN
jgi:ElaB/YqjD/DUF883 family membrane-anchored ribosome-binding protein